MKKVKIGLAVFVLAILGWFFYQNTHFFLAPLGLGFHFDVANLHWDSGEWPLILYLAVFFVLGFLVMYFISLKGKFAHNRAAKELNEKIAGLEAELDAARQQQMASFPAPGAEPVPPVTAPEPATAPEGE